MKHTGRGEEHPRVGQAEGFLAHPSGPPRGAVLVLAGSSGRIEAERCRLFAECGFVALSIRWFGGEGQPPGICEIALETFVTALETLAGYSHNLGIVGVSKGAEAALLVAARDARVGTVVALAPTDVVWANLGAGRDGAEAPARSSWTWENRALPFVPYDPTWEADQEPPSFAGLYRTSWAADPGVTAAASIPVETITATVVLVAGGDDRVWPSGEAAARIAARRKAAGLDTVVISHPGAGHRVIFPGEAVQRGGQSMTRGGSEASDSELGAAAWPAILAALEHP